MNFYDVIEIIDEWDEHLSLITVKNVKCKLKNKRTKEESIKIITFLQLIDYYDMKKYNEIDDGSSKIIIQSEEDFCKKK